VSDRRIDELARAASEAASRGALDNAAALWQQVLSLAPGHPRALLFTGQHALKKGDTARARVLIEQAGASAPNDPIVWLNLSFVHRATGDARAEMAALQRALAVDPYCFMALLAQGALLEREGNRKQAARVYKGALQIAPPEDRLLPNVRASLAQARAVINDCTRELDAFMAARLSNNGADNSVRMDEARKALVGSGKIYKSEASLLHIPRLPAIPFFDRSLFSWFAALEAQTDAIREELIGLLKARKGDFQPYMHYPAGTPLNQWVELNNSLRWSALYLWKEGSPVPEHAALCPRTMKAFESVPLARIPKAEPIVMFSALEPRTTIPAHTGISNARAVVHLPLIVPEKCRFRVGAEVREWKEGELWAFDDTMEHEAVNDSDQLRVILIFNIWNPFLDEAEQAAAAQMISGFYEFYGEQPE